MTTLPSPAALPTLPSLAGTESATPRNAGAGTLTRANTDYEAVGAWLAKYLDSPRTLDAYRREADRLLLWCSDRGIGLQALAVEDVLAYKAFLLDPQPPEKWCLQPAPRTLPDGSPNPEWRSVKRLARTLPDGTPNPAWRPFLSGLSDAAAKQASTILFGLFEYLAAVGYVAGNPFRAASRRRARGRRSTERYLDQATWQSVLSWLDNAPGETQLELAHRARDRFALTWLYLTGMRREEFVVARTSDLRMTRGQVWLLVHGKGGVEEEIPLQADAVRALREYRASHGLAPWPVPGDDTPLLYDVYGRRPLSVQGLHHLVKTAFSAAAEHANPDQAVVLRRASTHWMRHTAATHQLEAGVPARVVQRNLRHASMATTELYLHQEADAQAAATELHQVKRPTPG